MNAKKESEDPQGQEYCRYIADHFSNNDSSNCRIRNAVQAIANEQQGARARKAHTVQRCSRAFKRRMKCFFRSYLDTYLDTYLCTYYPESYSTRTFYLRVRKIRTRRTQISVKLVTGMERVLPEQKT